MAGERLPIKILHLNLLPEETEKLALGWDAKRALTKINYLIHTDSIKENIVIPQQLSQKDANTTYANEADILNKALFGMTALDWKNKNKTKAGNMRDYSDVYQLVCLANLETLNSEFIKMGMSQKDRLLKLNGIAIAQMKLLLESNTVKKLLNIVYCLQTSSKKCQKLRKILNWLEGNLICGFSYLRYEKPK